MILQKWFEYSNKILLIFKVLNYKSVLSRILKVRDDRFISASNEVKERIKKDYFTDVIVHDKLDYRIPKM